MERAGRLGYAERGELYVIGSRGLDTYRIWSYYVTGKPEDVKSVFLTQAADARTQVLRTLAALQRGADSGVDAELPISFLESSFGAFQQRQVNPAWNWGRDNILATLQELLRHHLVEIFDSDRYRLTDLGRLASEGGVFVDSIIRLVAVLRSVSTALNSTTLVAAAQVTRELDDVHMPFAKKAKNTEHRRWPHELAYQQVAPQVQSMLGIDGSDHLAGPVRAKKAMACLLYASGTPLSDIERHLMQHQLGDGAAGSVRALADRTRDLIPAVARVFAFLHPDVAIGDIAERTMARLELGLIFGVALTRAQYLRLFERGIMAPERFEARGLTASTPTP